MSQKGETPVEPDVAAKPKNVPSTKTSGWATMPSTSAFRAINFELYVRPNKYVMAIGATFFLGSIGYIVYMNLSDNKKKQTYVTLDEDGGLSTRPRVSRWE